MGDQCVLLLLEIQPIKLQVGVFKVELQPMISSYCLHLCIVKLNRTLYQISH